MTFKKAERKGLRLRLAILGPAKAGKTWWSLEISTRLAKAYDSRIAFIDSEQGSAKIYADTFDFDVLELVDDFSPQRYIDSMNAAAQAGYKVIVIDSLSHAYAGQGGLLDLHADATKKSRSGNSYTAWRDVTPLHNQMIDTILAYPGHLIATMRTKMAYELQENDRGKKQPVKIGLQPIQRDGLEYEFSAVADVNREHELIPGETRCKELDGKIFAKNETERVSSILLTWLGDQHNIAPPPGFDREQTIKRINVGLDTVFGKDSEKRTEWITKTITKYNISSPEFENMADEDLTHIMSLVADEYRNRQQEKKAS